jgi:hypothetical protein
MFGLVFYGTPTDTLTGMRSRMTICFIVPMLACLLPYVCISLYVNDKKIHLADASAKLYRPWAYYASKVGACQCRAVTTDAHLSQHGSCCRCRIDHSRTLNPALQMRQLVPQVTYGALCAVPAAPHSASWHIHRCHFVNCRNTRCCCAELTLVLMLPLLLVWCLQVLATNPFNVLGILCMTFLLYGMAGMRPGWQPMLDRHGCRPGVSHSSSGGWLDTEACICIIAAMM